MRYLLILALVLTGSVSHAKKVKYRKTQEVNFDAADVDGKVRNPDGVYMVQKRGIDFMPLYKVKGNFDDNIKDSVNYIK
jgi:hypothetical protein